MNKIRSKFIDGVYVNELDNRRFTQETEIDHGVKVAAIVLKVTFDHKTFYCCMSGGEMNEDKSDFSLTRVGKMTMDALLKLETEKKNPTIVFQEIGIGSIPLDQKVKRVLRKLPSGSKVCFVGDMAGELDGVLFNVFNVDGSTALLGNHGR